MPRAAARRPPVVRRRAAALVLAGLTGLATAGCESQAAPAAGGSGSGSGQASVPGGTVPLPTDRGGPPPGSTVELAFAGDVHFEGAQDREPRRSGSTLGPMSRTLRGADLAVVNLESALSLPGRPTTKELEDPGSRYWFRTPPATLSLLARSGVDVVSMANNHAGDMGVDGLQQGLAAAERSRVAVVGAGLDAEQAFAPHRTTIDGTDVAVLAADSSPAESRSPVWAARTGTGPGIAAARGRWTTQLLNAVRASAEVDDLTVVYLHWGEEGTSRVTQGQRILARDLAAAGADVVVGTHSHVLQGAGMLGATYVSYGLGNFYWYHGRQAETGVLRLTVTDGTVVRDSFVPGRIPPDGGAPRPLGGAQAAAAVREWRGLRAGTGLAALAPAASPDGGPAPAPAPVEPTQPALPPFRSQVRRIGPYLRDLMVGSSHDPARCPVPLRDLRHLTVSHVGFDGQARTGRIVVAAGVARQAVRVFADLYRARFPIERMVLVDAYGGDDDRSMAANNSSGYNCRTVEGSSSLSDHAYGRAIDLNPVQNPYLLGDQVLPPAGRSFADVDRSAGARPGRGVVTAGPVVRAFERAGWSWGGVWTDADYQHFYVD
ncbi:CapA family protein [Nocardioides litoris]|uniref:CapA family protein n=1 Tax=Nocardioides litoris TaxID=1926648 RepID=UPI0011210E67|nr:CapA family protein [Nocardioides litoris]